MIHPVFRLAASQPLLLAEHAVAYASLVSEELSTRSACLKRRLALQLAGAASLLVAAVLAGVSLLLWASLPDAGFRAPWLLLLTPALPVVLGLWALWLSQERESREPFANLRLQLAQDAALLRTPDRTMNAQPHPSTALSLSGTAPASPACDRLINNRTRLADWLEQDRAAQAHPSLGGWAARTVLPLIDGLRQHPTASLALGALAQAWLRPAPPAGGAQPLESQALGAALTTVRKHPKTTLAVAALAAAAWWWSRSRPHLPPP